MQIEIRTVSGLTVRGNYASDYFDLAAAMTDDVTLILLDATASTAQGSEKPTPQWMFRTRPQWMFRTRHIEAFRTL